MKKMLVGVLEGFMSCASSYRRTLSTIVCILMLAALPQTLHAAVTLNPGDILIVLDPNAFADGSGGVISNNSPPPLIVTMTSLGGLSPRSKRRKYCTDVY